MLLSLDDLVGLPFLELVKIEADLVFCAPLSFLLVSDWALHPLEHDVLSPSS